ncbi:hypothetical protein A6F68_02140 [Tsuneonella dongtanensis]|uniref:Phage holin family protein n=1 Tax=Tsuneonella dongtanensis TaxID=692370 RepID=A0A1B2AER8_9SPHN|nr:phage holin family protein [Tsuneonella dongtanensis]ANY20642.1 hypothetical protein A6F68_02140 [Tsuneonella dongtanensis]
MNTHDPGFDASVDDLSSADAVAPQQQSLTDDVFALLDDGRTLVETEIQFQKTRAAFAFDRGKSGAAFGVVAFALFHLALVALVVGAVIALTPVIGAWGATAVVVGILVIAGLWFALAAKRKFARLAAAYAETRE